MRILYLLFFLLGLASFSSFGSNSIGYVVPNDKGVLVVINEIDDQLNLNYQIHKMAKEINFLSVMDFRSFHNDYYRGLTVSELTNKIDAATENTIYFITRNQDGCSYKIFERHNSNFALDKLDGFLRSVGCNLNSLSSPSNKVNSIQDPISATNATSTLPIVYFQVAEREEEKLNTTVTASIARKGTAEELAEVSEIVVYSYALTADEGVDYVPFSKTVRFEAGQVRVLFTFELLESDGVSDEFGIGLRYPVNARISDDATESNKLLIRLYSDTSKDAFAITVENLPFYKEGEEYTLNLSRLNQAQNQAVEYNTELVGVGSEFVSSNTNFVFTPGVSSIDLKFKVNDDFKFNDEQRYVTFKFKETQKVEFPAGATVTLPIGDNNRSERGEFGFEYPRYVSPNGDGEVVVKVLRRNFAKSRASFAVRLKDASNAYSSEQFIIFEDGDSEVLLSLEDIPTDNSSITVELVPQVDVDIFSKTTKLDFFDLSGQEPNFDRVFFKSGVSKDVEEGREVTVTVERSGSLDYLSQVEVLASLGGSAVEGVDYVIKNKVLSFAPGQKSHEVIIEVTDDDVYTGNREFALKLFSKNMRVPSEDEIFGVVENDYDRVGVIGFRDSLLVVEEDQLRVPVYITRNVPGPAVELIINPVDGSAKAGIDYQWEGQQVVRFEQGALEAVVYLLMIDDEIPDFDKQFTLKLSSPLPLGFGKDEIVVSIIDNEKNNAIYVKPTGSQIVTENGAVPSLEISSADKFIALTLTRTVNVTQPIRLTVKSVNGSARDGVDFVGVNETILFGANEVTKEIKIGIRKSSIADAFVDFTLHITADTSNFIVENPALRVKITPAVGQVVPGEGGGSGGVFSWSLTIFIMLLMGRRKLQKNYRH